MTQAELKKDNLIIQEGDLLSFGMTEPSKPTVKGKFLFAGEGKIYIRGVTYGPFRPDEEGNHYRNPEVVERDFSRMTDNNINTIRVYTPPPRWLLDLAHKHGLWVMVGLVWEEHVTFLDYRGLTKKIEKRVRSDVQACANHPAVLCFALGNEIPASIVRWYGKRRMERFIFRLYRTIKDEAPETLVTYVNYPTTEYLQLPYIDFYSFNVYLEDQDRLQAYLSRLQNIAGDKPLVLAELGLDSKRNGEETQATSLDWQIRTCFQGGSAGVFIFSWTDEWFRGEEIEDWDFGLTRRDRSPKPALGVVCDVFSEVPFGSDIDWPKVSVVICSYNGAKTIRATCDGLNNLDYPDYEVIVVDDGSTDETSEIVEGYGFKLIKTENQGLSNARNTGMRASKGEIIAYLDDDAFPDPHWLKYLTHTIITANYCGVGGPNISPPDDGLIAECIDKAPGQPTHILITDEEAEHIPGCNMAFRKSALEAVRGFDSRFRIAGDDVDICWRLQERGWKLGFNHAAMVWHHRRNSVRDYIKQQLNYGKAEALLEQKWPEKYNTYGHIDWRGRLYGNGNARSLLSGGWRIYHGVWGSRYFQSLYDAQRSSLFSILLSPVWYIIIFGLLVLFVLGNVWQILFIALPLLGLTLLPPLLQAVREGSQASFAHQPTSGLVKVKLRFLVGALHLFQPITRLTGRLSMGLTPWRRRGLKSYANPLPRTDSVWSEIWQSSETRLERIEAILQKDGIVVSRGGVFNRWDLEIRGGMFAWLRMLMAIEEHGGSKQMLRFRSWPKISTSGIVLILFFSLLASLATTYQAWQASIVLAIIAALLILRVVADCSAAMAGWRRALDHLRKEEEKKINAQ